MDKCPLKCSLSIKSMLFMDKPSGRFRRSLIQRWVIRKGIPRVQSSCHADISFFYNDSIFFIMYGGSGLQGFHTSLDAIPVLVWSLRQTLMHFGTHNMLSSNRLTQGGNATGRYIGQPRKTRCASYDGRPAPPALCHEPIQTEVRSSDNAHRGIFSVHENRAFHGWLVHRW